MDDVFENVKLDDVINDNSESAFIDFLLTGYMMYDVSNKKFLTIEEMGKVIDKLAVDHFKNIISN